MIRELRKKFILINMLLVMLILICVFVGICAFSFRRIETQGNDAMQAVLDSSDGVHSLLFRIGGEIPEGYLRDPIFLVIIRQSGIVELHSTDSIDVDMEGAIRVANDVLSGGKESGVLKDYNLRFRIKRYNGITRIAFMELSYEQSQMRTTVLMSLLAGIAGLGAFFAVSVFLSRWALRPVERVWTQQRRFISDASHELKTPLTVIMANTGILESRPDRTIGSQMDWVESTGKQAGRMKKLVEDLLFLAKSDEANEQTPFVRINWSDLVSRSALAFEPVAYERDISLSTEIESNLFVMGDEGQLEQLAAILLDNAVKYSDAGGEVNISLSKRQSRVVMSVRNFGNFIPPKDIPHLFDRFYRADESRAEKGYGLGLSIAKSITDGCKGDITAESGAENGTIFTVLLPLAQ